jgi:transposase
MVSATLPECVGLRLDDVALTPTIAVALVVSTASCATCPRCGTPSDRVHSRYRRTVADLPCQDRPVALRLVVRRFRCCQPDCPQTIFCERLPELLKAHARSTTRLSDAHQCIGLALGGEAGARLANHLDMPTSPDTLLRRVKNAPAEPPPLPRYVGIDDWAIRKGQCYGTIVVDLERGCVLDLLPGRDGAALQAWLKAHPGVEVISRDRWASYAQAATTGAPQARQVADRWHLLKNLREAVEGVLERHAAVVDATLQATETPTAPVPVATIPETGTAPAPVEPSAPRPPSEPLPEAPRLHAEPSKRQKRIDRFEQVHAFHLRGHSASRIARALGLSRRSVFRYLRRETCPTWGLGRSHRSRLDGYREWIDARLAEGFTNVAALHRQLTERGFQGSYGSVYAFVMKRLGVAGKRRDRLNAAKPPVLALPSARQLSFTWARRAENRKPDEQARLDAIRVRSDALAAALDLADGFAELIRKRSTETLSAWLARAEACSDPDLRRFAEGVRRDEAAVHAAVTETWSNGPVEGHVNRLKTIKRQMYGRAGFVLLRARVLKAA